jgi:hypothetical protein
MSMTYWTSETEKAFENGIKGVEKHLDYLKKQVLIF